MPYIPRKRREDLRITVADLPGTSGELNYTLTQAVLGYLSDRGTSYSAMNDIIGALEACKLEFYRRVVVPYEETKREENGDVYEC